MATRKGKTSKNTSKQATDPRTLWERKMAKADVATVTREGQDLAEGKGSHTDDERTSRLEAVVQFLASREPSDLTENAKAFLLNTGVAVVGGTFAHVKQSAEQAAEAKAEAAKLAKQAGKQLAEVTKRQETLRARIAVLSYRLTSMKLAKQADLTERFDVSKGELSNMVAAARVADDYQAVKDLGAVTRLIHRKQQNSKEFRAELESGVSHEKLSDFVKAVDARIAESKGKKAAADSDPIDTLAERLDAIAQELVKINKAGVDLPESTDRVGGVEAVKHAFMATYAYLQAHDAVPSKGAVAEAIK